MSLLIIKINNVFVDPHLGIRVYFSLIKAIQETPCGLLSSLKPTFSSSSGQKRGLRGELSL